MWGATVVRIRLYSGSEKINEKGLSRAYGSHYIQHLQQVGTFKILRVSSIVQISVEFS